MHGERWGDKETHAMADQYRGRTRRNDDSLIPLITGFVVLAAVGPALFTAATQWVLPRLNAGGSAVSMGLAEWWSRNWWLAAFWVLELAVLFAVLGWSRRRRRRRNRQLESVVTGLTRALPADWEPERDLRVLRWNGHRPVRLRLQLTPRSGLDDPSWRRSLADAAVKVLGPLEPIDWPRPSRNGVFDWGARPPRIELKVAATPIAQGESGDPAPDSKLSANSAMRVPSRSVAAAEDLPIYRRPRPESPERVPAEHGSAPTRLDRED
jgi:hypothetical protein